MGRRHKNFRAFIFLFLCYRIITDGEQRIEKEKLGESFRNKQKQKRKQTNLDESSSLSSTGRFRLAANECSRSFCRVNKFDVFGYETYLFLKLP